jgi:hypothetical protein
MKSDDHNRNFTVGLVNDRGNYNFYQLHRFLTEVEDLLTHTTR